MVTFNLKFGVMKAIAQPGQGFKDQNMKGYRMVRVKKRKLAWVQLSSARDPDNQGTYHADVLGNIFVHRPKDINTMAGLGWPIYDGPGVGTVTEDQLIWPDKVTNVLTPELNPYERKIMESLLTRRGN